MRKVMTILGTRPELIKMSRVIVALDQCFDHILVHTGQNYDYNLNEIFFRDLGIRQPDHFLNAAGSTAIETIAEVLKRSDAVMEAERPEAVLIYGDTNSGLACIAAKRRKIPIFHMEAGNRSFDDRVPEEINRRIIDHTSDVNLVLTEHARRYLLAEGLPPDRIFKVGSHMQEVLDHAQPQIAAASARERLGLEAAGYILVSAHREENVDSPAKLSTLVQAMNRLTEVYGRPVIMSTHPRTQTKLDQLEEARVSLLVRHLPPFGFFDYIRLQMDAFAVISDSGTIAEEAALLNLPAVTIRDAHERPEGQDGGVVVVASKMGVEEIVEAVRIMRTTYDPDASIQRVADYAAGPVSTKVSRIVSGYIDMVNRTVWRSEV